MDLSSINGVLRVPASDGLQSTSSPATIASQLKSRLLDGFLSHNEERGKAAHVVNGTPPSDIQLVSNPLHRELARNIFSYRDIFMTPRNFELDVDADELRTIYVLHVLNHVFKHRNVVLKNNQKLKAAKGTEDETPELRDQGFTRPVVLLLVPFRSTALAIVKQLAALSGTKQQENWQRFLKEYSSSSEQNALDESKPEDYKRIFGGNIDDSFRVGVQFSGKNMKLFSDFYSSDILIASPLGLRMAMDGVTKGKPTIQADFLSSIEVVILDHADVILQQNFDHVQVIFENLNTIPKENHDCNFSRVRSWNLDGKAKYLRQSILLSSYLFPELLHLSSSLCANISGSLYVKTSYRDGAISKTSGDVPQTFQFVEGSESATSPEHDSDLRFNFFVERVLKSVNQSTIVFISHYFDFLKLRNHLEEKGIEFGELSEYTPGPSVNRSRSHFMNGKLKLLLVTERFHFYHRYKLRGMEQLVFYTLPLVADFYAEFVKFFALQSSGRTVKGNPSVTALFSKFDKLKLERILGEQRARQLSKHGHERKAWLFA
ncbi:DUF1253-domain-containing protein [Gonapodya prolifera JEL478]|uniref:U3 small nucleolar RNA-associated protein 25 n=1 Tax=Gonapodya prolifera (strain JEL478) TaxID=1344416 RepID=A0A139A3K2_GONPJ|nr:DUF1253-domain-containing protein [Gonapodya prolifera JEL478]|eukprot:KXS11396.1 DUF1253-domain-containing protein [Gonapodya prolifera JEL478]